MKTIIGIAILLLLFGCASTPSVTMVEPTVPEGCVKTAIEGDTYSYQGAIDPRTIHEEWIEIEDLQSGPLMALERYYRNPDPLSNIPVASLLQQFDICVALAYLIDGELKVFYYDGNTNCYTETEVSPEQERTLREWFATALGWEGS